MIFPDIDLTDSTTAKKTVYSDCHSNRQVVFYEIEGGGHSWPGSSLLIDPTNKDINASREIWEFFLQYQEPISVATEEVEAIASVKVFPNPVEDILVLETDELIQSVQVSNSLGQYIFGSTDLANNRIDTQGWERGLYFLQVKTDQGQKLLKVLKN